MIGKVQFDRFLKVFRDLELLMCSVPRSEQSAPLRVEDIAPPVQRGLDESVSLGYFRMVRLLPLRLMPTATGKRLMYEWGYDAGKALPVRSLDDLKEQIRAMGLARAEITQSDDPFRIIVKLQGSAVSSALPLMPEQICHFESGLLAGALERVTGKALRVTETKCSAIGYDYCQFEAEIPLPQALDEFIEFNRYAPESVEVLTNLVAHVYATLRTVISYESTRTASIIDPVTMTFSRDYLKMRLAEEVQRAERKNSSFSLVIAELPGLAAVEDSQGRVAADAVLGQTAGILKENIRGIDALGRYRDNAFMLILPQTDRQEAGVMLERIGARIDDGGKELPFPRLTVRFGCARFPQDGRYSDQVIDRAEFAAGCVPDADRSAFSFYADAPEPVSSEG